MPQGNCLVPLGIDQFVHPQFVEFAGESLECKKRSTSIAVRIRQFTVAFLITINGIAQPFEFVERRLELRVRQFHILQQCRCGEFQLWGSLRGACTLIWRVHPQKFEPVLIPQELSSALKNLVALAHMGLGRVLYMCERVEPRFKPLNTP